MRTKSYHLFILLTLFCFLFLGCTTGGGNLSTQPSYEERLMAYWGNYPELGEGVPSYTVLPIDIKYVDKISPLGHLNPPGHPIPTSHVYWELARTDLCPSLEADGFKKPVRAPANGVITKITFTLCTYGANSYPDYSIVIRHTNDFITQFYHLSEIDSSISKEAGPLKEGYDGNTTYISVEAGNIIGKTAATYEHSAALDMGAYHRNTTHFIHPEKYPIPIPNAVCPLDYFSDELKSTVFSKVKRTAEPRGGEFDFDQLGKLVGNWFLEGTTGSSGDGTKNFLSFAYDMYDPTYLRVSLGEKIGGYLRRVQGNAPDFKEVDISSGEVIYKLMPVSEGDEFFKHPLPSEVVDTLLVQMINDEKIKVELFERDVKDPSFTSNAKYYTR